MPNNWGLPFSLPCKAASLPVVFGYCWEMFNYGFVMHSAAAAAAKLLQTCPTLCDPIDGSPPGSPIPGILQARTLEWVAISFSNAWKWKVKVKSLSCVRLLATPWTAAYQAPPSMGFSRQEYWSGVPLPSLNGSVRSVQIDWIIDQWSREQALLLSHWIPCTTELVTDSKRSCMSHAKL